MGLYLKDLGASLDYAIDWSENLCGATIAESRWTVEPDEPGGLRAAADFRESGRTAVTLEGGAMGRIYRVANTITRSDGREDARSLVIRVEKR